MSRLSYNLIRCYLYFECVISKDVLDGLHIYDHYVIC